MILNILKALEKFIKSGKIRYIGFQMKLHMVLSKYLEISKNKDLPKNDVRAKSLQLSKQNL